MANPTLTESASELHFDTPEWGLRVRVGDRLDPYRLEHKPSGRLIADQSYCYQLVIGAIGHSGYTGPALECIAVRPSGWAVEGATLILHGRLDFGPTGPTDVELEHRIELPEDGSVREDVALLHPHGRDRHSLSGLRFGFRKILFDRGAHSWVDGADAAELIPLPLRRREGQFVDHKMAGYSAADLMPEEWTKGGLPDRAAEAWLWHRPGAGFLVAKYNQEHIEFSVADGEFVVSDEVVPGDMRLTHLNSKHNLCLRFGGVGIARGCPESAAVLEPGQRLGFGTTIIRSYVGDVADGYAAYKKVLQARGHGIPQDYRPRIHWNELYRLGWRCGDNSPLQQLPELWDEAARAQAIGAQAFYFDPGWDLFEGSSVWDTARLGPAQDFVARLRDEYGLSLALHTMMHTKSLDEDPAIYRRTRDGSIDVWADSTPYSGGYVCPASPAWQKQKSERLLALAEAGTTFFMFDFLSYERAVIQRQDQPHRDIGTCWSPDHGHSVPLSKEEHAEGIMSVIRAIKQRYPDVSIEAHDRIGGEFLPLYFQHGPVDAHDELWGFEYMWDPYADLLSGKALSLYEYNLAYDIPLYLHLNSAHDSPQLLAFWWYASTCRHLGIGGIDQSDAIWPAYAAALVTYLEHQQIFAQGEFVGIDQVTHLHVAPDRRSGMLVAFNLTSEPVTRKVVLLAGQFAGKAAASSVPATSLDDRLELELTIEPLSPVVVTIATE